LSEILGKALPFLLLPMLTRIFTPEEYGALTEFTVFYNLCFTLASFSVFGFLRKLYFDNVDFGFRYINALMITLLISFMCLASIELAKFIDSNLFVSIDRRLYIVILISVVTLVAYKLMMTIINCTFNAGGHLTSNLVLTLVNLALTFIFLFAIETSFNGRILGILLTPIFLFPISLYVFNRYSKITFTIKFQFFKDQSAFSLPLVVHNAMSWIRVSADRILVSSNLGLATLGVYSANAQIAMIYFVIFGALNQALAPKIVKEYKDSKKDYLKLAKKFLYLYLGVFVIIFPVLYLISPILLGSQFNIDIKVLLILSISYLFNGWYMIYTHYLIQNGLGSVLSKISTYSAIIHLGIIFIFISNLGIDSVLIASFFSYLLAFILIYLNVRKRVLNDS
jgi:O-antigen/teichoic acid export membrane protein